MCLAFFFGEKNRSQSRKPFPTYDDPPLEYSQLKSKDATIFTIPKPMGPFQIYGMTKFAPSDTDLVMILTKNSSIVSERLSGNSLRN